MTSYHKWHDGMARVEDTIHDVAEVVVRDPKVQGKRRDGSPGSTYREIEIKTRGGFLITLVLWADTGPNPLKVKFRRKEK